MKCVWDLPFAQIRFTRIRTEFEANAFVLEAGIALKSLKNRNLGSFVVQRVRDGTDRSIAVQQNLRSLEVWLVEINQERDVQAGFRHSVSRRQWECLPSPFFIKAMRLEKL